MDIDTLRTFLLLSQNKSFTKTAEIQHIVQSTVSMRIKDLENELGKPLFYRDNRRVELTADGLLYVDYAERLINLFEESKSKLYTSQYYGRSLSIGGVDIIWRCFLFDLTKRFLMENPTVSIRAITYSSDFVSQLLLDNTIDVAFTSIPLKAQKIVCIQALSDDIIFVVSPRHEIAKKAVLDIEELETIPMVYGDIGSTFTGWYERNLPTSHNLRIKFDVTSLTIPFLLDGFGPGLILRSMVEKELREGSLIELPLYAKEPLPRWVSYMSFDKAKRESKEIGNLIAILRELHYSH